MKKYVFAILLLTFVACSGGAFPDAEPFRQSIDLGKSTYYDLGDGRGLMSDSMTSIFSGANFEVSFELSDGGSFELYTFANSYLDMGLSFTFTRRGNQLLVFANWQSKTQDLSSKFAGVNAASTITMTLEVHNQETPAHVLMWNASRSSQLNILNTIYNSANDSQSLGYSGSPGNGISLSWGFRVENSRLLKASLSNPQEHP
ncbi:hypothetical protein [Bdellovibrio bacteriovorus]|uniref:hypothetical protein n=1 Tax=Bdellovibrio bacteriovorus TaxID=959 RepID=UPI0035A671B2